MEYDDFFGVLDSGGFPWEVDRVIVVCSLVVPLPITCLMRWLPSKPNGIVVVEINVINIDGGELSMRNQSNLNFTIKKIKIKIKTN